MPRAGGQFKGPTTEEPQNGTEIPAPEAGSRVRYWLRNNTYVDLNIPFEVIGTPFDSSSAASTSISDDDRTRVLTDLKKKCEPLIRAGDLHVLALVLEICNRGAL